MDQWLFFYHFIKNKSENRHKSYEPYELNDRLRRINRIRDEKLRLAYRLMIVSGLRVFEVEALIKEDIEIKNNDIFVTVRDGKGGKYGEVKCLEDKYLSNKLKNFLQDKDNDEKLFYATRTMQAKAQELGFKCHDLRRAYAKLVKKELMKELVEVIAKSLVDYPDEVNVTETENEKAIVLELRVAQSDMGKVIGKQGRIAKAIRSVVKAAASKEDKKVIVEIVQ